MPPYSSIASSLIVFSLYFASSLSIIDLPWTESDEAAMEWCETEVPLQRIVQTLMAYNINSKSVARLESKWFDREVSYADSPSRMVSNLPATPFAERKRARAIFGARRLQDMDSELIDAHRSLRRAASPLKPLMALVPIIADMVDVRDADNEWNADPATVPLPAKMRKYSNSVCRLSDIEYGEGVAPYSCAILDIFKSYFLCQKKDELPIQELLEKSMTCAKSAVISHFPYSTLCYVPERALQRQSQALSAAMFYWSDPDLHIPLMLHDFLVNGSHVPKFIPTEIRQSEIFTYLTLYKALRHLSTFSANSARDESLIQKCQRPDTTPVLIPGWHTVQLINARSRDNVTRPLAAISVDKENPCDIAIGFRGLQTKHGWFLGLDTRSAPSAGANVTHSGLLRLLSPTLAEVQYFIAEHIQSAHCTCESTRVMLYGHSMGASLAQLVSQHIANDRCFKVEAVLFSPLRVLTSRSQRKHYTQTVNSRTLIDISDGLYHFPCFERNAVHGTVRCPSDNEADIQHLLGSLGSSGRDYYVENHGLILLDVDYTGMGLPRTSTKILQTLTETFPFASAVLMSLIDPSLFEALPSPEVLNAAHFCAQACALSAACMGDNELGSFRWWCEDCPVVGTPLGR